jgi:hypothetical protein
MFFLFQKRKTPPAAAFESAKKKKKKTKVHIQATRVEIFDEQKIKEKLQSFFLFDISMRFSSFPLLFVSRSRSRGCFFLFGHDSHQFLFRLPICDVFDERRSRNSNSGAP